MSNDELVLQSDGLKIMVDNKHAISNVIRNRLNKENSKKGNESKQNIVTRVAVITNTQSNFHHHTPAKSYIQPNKTPERQRPTTTSNNKAYSSPERVRLSASSNKPLGSPPTSKMTSSPGDVVYDSPFKKSRNNVPTSSSPEAVKSTPGVHTSGVVNRPGPLFSNNAKKVDVDRSDWRDKVQQVSDRGAVDRKDSDTVSIYSSESLNTTNTNTASEMRKLVDMPKISSLPKPKSSSSSSGGGFADLFSPPPIKVVIHMCRSLHR
jgi:hypothetical protein